MKSVRTRALIRANPRNPVCVPKTLDQPTSDPPPTSKIPQQEKNVTDDSGMRTGRCVQFGVSARLDFPVAPLPQQWHPFGAVLRGIVHGALCAIKDIGRGRAEGVASEAVRWKVGV